MVKVDNITMEGVQFSIHDIEGIEFLLDELINNAINQLSTSTEKYKKVVAKILKAWEKSPESFKKQKASYSSETYINKGLLTDREYFAGPFYSVAGSFEGFSECRIPTGCGEDTYYAPERYKQGLAQVDAWVEKTIKGLKTTKSRDKLKKKMYKSSLFLSFSELDKWFSIPVNSEPEKRKKITPFPFQIDGELLNRIMRLSEADAVEVDEEFIEYAKEELDIDISFLLGYEIASESHGKHYNDGQMVEYTLTLTSPEGNSYQAYDLHSLVTGWSFYGPVEFTQVFK
jgi:hypothetical protein